jgi:hypothetical protein
VLPNLSDPSSENLRLTFNSRESKLPAKSLNTSPRADLRPTSMQKLLCLTWRILSIITSRKFRSTAQEWLGMLSINDIIEISICNDYICHYKVIIIFENNIIIASDVQTDDLGWWHMELVIYTSLEILIKQSL